MVAVRAVTLPSARPQSLRSFDLDAETGARVAGVVGESPPVVGAAIVPEGDGVEAPDKTHLDDRAAAVLEQRGADGDALIH